MKPNNASSKAVGCGAAVGGADNSIIRSPSCGIVAVVFNRHAFFLYYQKLSYRAWRLKTAATLDHFRSSRLVPVICDGLGTPSMSSSVGATSAKMPSLT